MSVHAIDDYLLGSGTTKGQAISAALAQRSPTEAAAPFYRALEAVGTRAADEALIALRLVLAGKPPSDEYVRRLRALTVLARAARRGDESAVRGALRAGGTDLAGCSVEPSDFFGLDAFARGAYEEALR